MLISKDPSTISQPLKAEPSLARGLASGIQTKEVPRRSSGNEELTFVLVTREFIYSMNVGHYKEFRDLSSFGSCSPQKGCDVHGLLLHK
jgi:hypothetical protein